MFAARHGISPATKTCCTKIHLLVFSLKYENIREANLSFFVLIALLAKNTNSAARHGLEPRFLGPKPSVLPLDDRAIFILSPRQYNASDSIIIFEKW